MVLWNTQALINHAFCDFYAILVASRYEVNICFLSFIHNVMSIQEAIMLVNYINSIEGAYYLIGLVDIAVFHSNF